VDVRDEKLILDLYEQCKVELRNLDDLHNLGRQTSSPSDIASRYVTAFDCRERILLIMERLANGEAPPRGKTVWEHVSKDDA
jgi:hypothetical protein